MNRYQKKCLIASGLMHGLLVCVLIFGTAFLSPKEPPIDQPRLIELLPNMTVTDGPTRGGGGTPAPPPAQEPPPPAPKPVEPVQARPAPTPEPERPKPVVEKPKPEPKPEPKVETVSELPTPKPKKRTPKPVVETPKPTPPKPTVDISKPIIRDTKQKQALAEAAERAEQEQIRNQRIAALSGARQNLQRNLSNDSPIEALGGSGGGAAEINYRDLVFSMYDRAWVAPTDVEDDEATTKARVVIARSGNVISAEVIKASRNSKLDRSVRHLLDSLRFIHPFPEGSRDSQRTFIINFNLKSKRGFG